MEATAQSVIALSTWQAISLMSLFVGSVWAFGKVLFSQIEKRLDERFGAQEQARIDASDHWESRFGKLETFSRNIEREVLTLKSDLPLHYYRREDAIREQAVLHAKIDALAAKIELIIERTK